MTKITTGLENLITARPGWMSKNRLGLLSNPASIDSRYRHASKLIHRYFPDQLTALFSPQHGFFGEKQDNMIESADMVDPKLKIPVFSLYGKTRVPSPQMLDHIDVLIVDLIDVGTRVYTFTSTLSYCLEACARLNKRVVVLDRPNPINGLQVEGNCLSMTLSSFVGRYPIPMRHGLTMGEYAAYINHSFNINCPLEVIPMKGWNRRMYFQHTGIPWVPPSPNLPTPASAIVYPGQVIWEGTNISEGRGTTLPFEQFGAPFVDIDKVLSFMGGPHIPGGILRPATFEPTSNKWAGQTCNGFCLHITDPYQFKPYATSLKLLSAIIYHHKNQFQWKQPPYEYEWEKRPFDMIVGNDIIRQQLENAEDIDNIQKKWAPALTEYQSAARKFHLYK
ncbi:MAG: exo-beta-N-acetylmuramidase NamZ domain-containing protein [Dissulfuribacterales bacterium]